MHILLAGKGRMAQAIKDACAASGVPLEEFEADLDLAGWSHKDAVAIHVGSGRNFDRLLCFCEEHRIPLIQASTEQSKPQVTQPKTVVVMAPNLSEPMAAFTTLVSRFKDAVPGLTFGISEPGEGKKEFPEEYLYTCACAGVEITLHARVESCETHAKGALLIAERAHQIRAYHEGIYVVSKDGVTLLRAPCRTQE